MFFLLTAVWAAAWLSPGAASADQELRSTQKDLEKIQRELSRKTSERAEAARKEKELAEEVRRISRELNASRRSLKEIESRLEETESRRKATEERLWVSRLEMGQWGDLLARELRLYYERKAALGAAAAVELAYRRAAMEERVNGLSFARQHHAQVEGLRDELIGLEVELQKLRLRREKEEKRVASAQEQMRSLHKTVQGRRAVLENEIRDLRSSARALERLVQKLIREEMERVKAAEAAAAKAKKPRPAAAPSAARKGRLPWPVEGKVVERYGRSRHPELDTYVFSNGVKLQPAERAAVRSVDKGEVLYAGEFMSYGLMALVSHPNNLHSIYAHLGQIKVARGQKVSVGEVVGSSGQDGAGRPLVYFELRVGGVAVDPLLWLK